MTRILNLTIQICDRQGSGFGVPEILSRRTVLETLLNDLKDPNGVDNYVLDIGVKITGINAETNEVIEL